LWISIILGFGGASGVYGAYPVWGGRGIGVGEGGSVVFYWLVSPGIG
jgi:hypothetical protein